MRRSIFRNLDFLNFRFLWPRAECSRRARPRTAGKVPPRYPALHPAEKRGRRSPNHRHDARSTLRTTTPRIRVREINAKAVPRVTGGESVVAAGCVAVGAAPAAHARLASIVSRLARQGGAQQRRGGVCSLHERRTTLPRHSVHELQRTRTCTELLMRCSGRLNTAERLVFWLRRGAVDHRGGPSRAD